MPFDWGYFAFVYDNDKLKAPPASLEGAGRRPEGPDRRDRGSPHLDAGARPARLDEARSTATRRGEAWTRLRPRVVTVTKGWSEAYGLFLKGEADMVLSYSTSPAYHIGAEKKTNYRAAMFAEGHATQVEVAGVVASSKQPELARKFLAFLLTAEAQALLPETNWMYPAKTPAGGLPEELLDHRRAGEGAALGPGRARRQPPGLDRRMARRNGEVRRRGLPGGDDSGLAMIPGLA